MNNSSETIRNRTRDLPACSAMSEPTAPQLVPNLTTVAYYSTIYNKTSPQVSLLLFPTVSQKFARPPYYYYCPWEIKIYGNGYPPASQRSYQVQSLHNCWSPVCNMLHVASLAPRIWKRVIISEKCLGP